MSEKALRWIIYLAGAVCLYLFLSVRILPLFNGILLEKYIPEYWENTKWGELYYFNFVKDFREEGLPEHSVKYRFTDRHPSADDADILAFGDSFFDFSRMTTFPEQLGDSLNKRVFYARFDQPLRYLAENNYTSQKKKYVIYETAERFLHHRFEEPQQTEIYIDNRADLRKIASNLRDWIFLEDTELLYSLILTRSYFSTHIYSALSTFKFDVFKQITTQTPAYKTDGERPWLFGSLQLSKEQGGYYYDTPAAEIENYCNNIEHLANNLREKYNMEMIFMIIPSKYTVYHEVIGEADSTYGNFIPKMYTELEKRNIPVIKFYDEFMQERNNELLYYGTDTHWTEDGLHIALNSAIDMFNTLETDTYYSFSPAQKQTINKVKNN